uniref:Pyrin domain-containing protein n=1 Tax=Sander lucioperca TaxID=283035 RepID=A0A8C9X9S5_SANLU
MTAVDLFNILEDLKEEEFKKFKWCLQQDILEGYQSIKVSKLENVERQDMVDVMVKTYQLHGALKVTKKVLEKINRNDLWVDMRNTILVREQIVICDLLIQLVHSAATHSPAVNAMNDASFKIQEATMTKMGLFNTLKDLNKEEFELFKWCLQQPELLEGYKSIQVSKLENAGRRDTVDEMVKTYQLQGALKVTKTILEKIKRNDLVQSLPDTSSGPEGQSPFLICIFRKKEWVDMRNSRQQHILQL